VTEFLDRDDVLIAGAAAVGNLLQVRDYGLLDAAIARPKATVFGLDAYPDDFTKAAALLQSLARDHAFVDGNKRTAWASGRHSRRRPIRDRPYLVAARNLRCSTASLNQPRPSATAGDL
jgi:hypothetical protein